MTAPYPRVQDSAVRWGRYLAVALLCQGGAALLVPAAARQSQFESAPLEMELVVGASATQAPPAARQLVAAVEKTARPGLQPAREAPSREAQTAPPPGDDPRRLHRNGAPRLPADEPVHQRELSPPPASVPTPVPVPATPPPGGAAPAPLPLSLTTGMAALPPRSASAAGAHHPAGQQRQEGGGRPREAQGRTAGEPAARLGDYLTVIRSMVENNREYPATARQLGLQGTVTVRLSIRGDGSIGAMAISSSAGHKSLDKAALSAVRRAAPFRTPGGFGLSEVTVEIPIVYRLT